MHCKTYEEAKDFCWKMHEQGMRWLTKERYSEKIEYAIYEEKTCYTGGGTFGPLFHFIDEGYEILEWSDYMQKEFTKADLKDGMVVEQRDGDMYLVLAGMVVRKRGYNRIGDYDDDLKCAGYTGGDIVKVYRITPGSLGCVEHVFIKCNLELIWERKERKKMTIEEMRKKLKELTGEEIEVTT